MKIMMTKAYAPAEKQGILLRQNLPSQELLALHKYCMPGIFMLSRKKFVKSQICVVSKAIPPNLVKYN
jgi:hypothetical protein